MGSVWISIPEYNQPEDNNLSSGYSVLKSSIGGIDNYSNVNTYKYTTKFNTNSDSVSAYLKDLSFWFMDYIDVFQDPEEVESVEGYPQGLCFTEDYMLVTFYTKEKEIPGQLKVFDRTTGLCVLILGMDGDSHLGGIAYDGENVWVCNSAKMTLEKFPYEKLVSMVEENYGQFVDITSMVQSYSVKNVPSCITYYDNALWVGTHTLSPSSSLIKYVFNKGANNLISAASYKAPSKVQGVSFDEDGAIYLSISYGRKTSSFMKKYASVEAMTENIDEVDIIIEMPPCSEGIVWEKEKIYVLFESAAKKYLKGTDGNGTSIAPLDRILVIDLTTT